MAHAPFDITDDRLVRWARLGEGGDPIVPVHGTPYPSYLWRSVAPALALSHTVYMFDLLGSRTSTRART